MKARKGQRTTVGSGGFEQLGDHHGNVARRGSIETSTLWMMDSGHDHAFRSQQASQNQQIGRNEQPGSLVED